MALTMLRFRTMGAASAALILGCAAKTPEPATAANDSVSAPATAGAAQAAGAPASARTPAADAPREAAAPKPEPVAVESRLALPGSARATFTDATRAFSEGRLADAKTAFEKAGAAAPANAAPRVGAGAVLEREGDAPGAVGLYRRAAALEPADPEAARALVLGLIAIRETAEAMAFARHRAEKFAKSPAAATLHSEAASAAGDSATAQAEAQRALALDSSYVPAMLAVARDHYRAGRVSMTDYALRALLDGIDESTPARAQDCAEALLLRAIIDRRVPGGRTRALDGFAKVHALRPDLTEAALALGVMKLEAGNAADAIVPLEVAARFAPKNAFVMTALGDAYRLAGRYAEAKTTLEKALSVEGSLAAPHYNLALLFLYAGDKLGVGNEERYASAKREMEAYLGLRGPKAPPGVDDDADSLLSAATRKLAEVTAK